MVELFYTLAERIKTNKPSVLITITKTRGGTPGKTGFKVLVGEEGRIAGTIGGGAVEFHAINKCKELFNSKDSFFNEIIQLVDSEKQPLSAESISSANLNKQLTKLVLPAWCGGEVELFYEIYSLKKILYIFGAGHVGAAVAELAVRQGFFVEMFDNRKDILDAIPENSSIIKHFNEYPPSPFNFELNKEGYALIVTQSHKNDLPVLEFLLNNYPGLKYIGMIGSKPKVTECIRIVKEKYKDNISLNNLYAPVGINIGGDTPMDISLSILAELFAVINNKPANHMRLTYSEIE